MATERDDIIERLRAHNRAVRAILDEPGGDALSQFVEYEIELRKKIDSVIAEQKPPIKPFEWKDWNDWAGHWKRLKSWASGPGKKFGEKLFDKINKMVTGYIGGPKE